MGHYFGMNYGIGVPTFSPAVGILLGLLILWSIVWKGLALWRAAKRGDMIWFIIFLILNTAGILEIIYLFFVAGTKFADFTISRHSHKN